MCHGQMIHFGVRNARKPHRCEMCNGEIRKGRRYFWGAWTGDGRMEAVKRCLTCTAIVEASVDEDQCFYGNPRDEMKHEARVDGWRATLKKLREFKARWTKKETPNG